MSAARAVAFDFNGTLSHDEPILFAVYREMSSARGRPLSADDYYGALAGLVKAGRKRTPFAPVENGPPL